MEGGSHPGPVVRWGFGWYAVVNHIIRGEEKAGAGEGLVSRSGVKMAGSRPYEEKREAVRVREIV